MEERHPRLHFGGELSLSIKVSHTCSYMVGCALLRIVLVKGGAKLSSFSGSSTLIGVGVVVIYLLVLVFAGSYLDWGSLLASSHQLYSSWWLKFGGIILQRILWCLLNVSIDLLMVKVVIALLSNPSHDGDQLCPMIIIEGFHISRW